MKKACQFFLSSAHFSPQKPEFFTGHTRFANNCLSNATMQTRKVSDSEDVATRDILRQTNTSNPDIIKAAFSVVIVFVVHLKPLPTNGQSSQTNINKYQSL